MRIDDGGGPLVAPQPPPPANPPTQDQVKNLRQQRDAAQDKLDQDKKLLAGLEADLQNAIDNPPVDYNVGLATSGDTDDIGLGARIDDAKKKVADDQAALDTANANLQAAEDVKKAADDYKPTPSTVTVSTDATKAVDPLLNSAQAAANTDQANVNADQAALDATNNKLAALDSSDAVGRGAETRRNNLLNLKTQQENQLHIDQQKLTNDKAIIAGANVVRYNAQTDADRKTALDDLKSLQHMGIVDGDGVLKVAYDKLTPEQKAAYDKFAADATKLAADKADLEQNYSQLQQYTSEPDKYGNAGKDALGKLNKALAPVNLRLNKPKHLDAATADANVNNANAAALNANAVWNSAAAVVGYDEATRKLAELKGKNPYDLSSLLPGAQLEVTKAQARLDQALSYEQTLGLQTDVAQDDAAVNKARAAYAADPSAENWTTLNNALKKAQTDKDHLQLANSTFLAGTAEVITAGKSGQLTLDQGKVAGLEQSYGLVSHYGGPGAAGPLSTQLDQARSDLRRDQLTVEPYQSVTDELGAVANFQSSNINVADAKNAAGAATPYVLASYSPDQKNADQANTNLKNSELQQDVAQYQLLLTDFRLTLPQNLLNPTSEADQMELDRRWNEFFSKQHVDLTDPTIANQLLKLAPDQKVDTQVAINELKNDQGVETKVLADRSVLEHGWDAMTGSKADTQTFIDDTVKRLHDLDAKKDSMNAADFNAEYLDIMGNASTRFGSLLDHQIDVSNNWHVAEMIVEETVIMVAAIAVGSVTGGVGGVLLGGGAGFLLSQGFATAQNYLTASEGGDVRDNSEVSLVAALTNNFHTSQTSSKEWSRAGVDAGIDAATSLATVAGAKFGTRIALRIAARPGVQALSGTLGKVVVRRAVPAMASMGANGLITNPVQIVTTTGKSIYQVTQGEITSDEAGRQIGNSFVQAGISWLTGTLAGGASGIMPGGVKTQFVTNAFTGFGLTYAIDAFGGRSFSRTDTLSVVLNAVSAAAIHKLARRQQQEVRQGDPRSVAQKLAEENGDPAAPFGSWRKSFGSGRKDGKQLDALDESLRKAGYTLAVRSAVDVHLRTLSKSAARNALKAVDELTPEDHKKIRGLITKLSTHGDEVGAQLLLDVATLEPASRAQFLANAKRLDNKTGRRDLLAFLNSAPDPVSATMKARQIEFALWLGEQKRADALASLKVLRELDSQQTLTAADVLSMKAAVKGLAGLANGTSMPRTFADFRSGTSSLIYTAINAMPLAGVRANGAEVGSDYDAAVDGIVKMINERLQAKKNNQNVETLRVTIETGAVALDGNGTATPSAYGVIGAATFARALQELGTRLSLPIEITQLTDKKSAPLLEVANQAFRVAKDTRFTKVSTEEFPKSGKKWLKTIAPHAFVAIGSSTTGAAPTTLLPQAMRRNGTMTFAIGDGTLAGGGKYLPQVDHPMTAWNVNLGAEAFSGLLLKKANVLPGLHTPKQVRKAYNAVIAKGAVRDDDRFANGANPDTLSVNAHVGASRVLRLGLDQLKVDHPATTWRDELFMRLDTPAQMKGVTLGEYDQLLQAAYGKWWQRAGSRAHELFFETNPRERTIALTSAALATAGAVTLGAHVPVLVLGGIAGVGTGIRQVWIIKMTNIKRGRQVTGQEVPTDDKTQRDERRRMMKSDFVRFVTYPVTGMSVINELLYGNFAPGWAGSIHKGGDVLLVGAVGVLYYLYGNKLLNARLDADGTYHSSAMWDLTRAKSRLMTYGAYGSFSAGSGALVTSLIMRDALRFDTIGSALNSVSLGIRAFGNFGQTFVAIAEHRQWPSVKENLKKYAYFDRAITVAQSSAVIVSASAVPIVTHFLG